MKLLIKALIILSVILVIGFLYSGYDNGVKNARISHCFINGNVYYTHDDRNYIDSLPQDYIYYGKINHKVEGYETSTIDLTSNASVYYGKEVFVNSKDNLTIYIEYEDSKYLKLNKEDE